MTGPAAPDWQEVERLARTTDLPLNAIARQTAFTRVPPGASGGQH
jgi:hypothetical protein